MVRQFWIYLLEEDEADLFAAIEAAAPGTTVAPGRFVRGERPERLLQGDQAGLTFPALSGREAERLVFHREASKSLVLHPVTEGPLQGAQSIDASFSDALLLRRPLPNRGCLEPARLMGETHVMRAERKLRKSPTYSVWVGTVLRKLRGTFPQSSVDFIYVAPKARAWAEAGQGKLTYLYQPVGVAPAGPAPTPVTTPQKR
jgi:hypothetical protein